MKLVIIMRGLPGSFRDSLSEHLLWSTLAEPLTTELIKSTETDTKKIQQAYAKCFQDYKKAIKDGIEIIIINNSNIKRHHYSHYIEHARRSSYEVAIIITPVEDMSPREIAEKSAGQVTVETARRMKNDFEWQF